MPGLDPGIHAFVSIQARKTWMAGTKPGHDDFVSGSPRRRIIISENRKVICRFVKPLLQKYIAFHFCKSELYRFYPASIRRGGSRLSRTRGGMRWTRGRLRDWQRARGRPSRVVLAPRRWCQVCGTTVPQAMVAKKPGTPGRARSNRNTIAQGMPVCFRRTCGEYARMLCFYLHARLRVRLASGIPCALLVEGC
jgi:hypothetical protein